MTAVICLLAALVTLAFVALDVLLVAILVSRASRTEVETSEIETGEDKRKPGALDAGFENLMTFSARGKMGFGEDE